MVDCGPEVTGSPVRDRRFRWMLFGAAGAFLGYALLLPVVPLWVVRQQAGEFVAGAATGAFMASTVLVQFAVPALARRFGYRLVGVFGGLLLGVPAPLLAVTTEWPGIIAVSLARGVGFGLITVCGSALIAELLPGNALAKGSGLYGLAAGLPQLLGLPSGTWLAEHWGFAPVFVVGGVVSVLGAAAFAVLGRVHPHAERPGRGHFLSTVDATWRPWLVMLAGSIGFGALATFLPIAIGSPGVVTLTLLLTPGAALLARFGAGLLADRMPGAGRLLAPALALVATGLAAVCASIALGGSGVLAVAGVTLFGLGFGAVQNDALVAMFAKVPAGPASVVWNVAFDSGQGAGAVVVGAIVSATSFPLAFALLAAFAIVLLPIAVRARSG